MKTDEVSRKRSVANLLVTINTRRMLVMYSLIPFKEEPGQ
jgi:hypothetical protein